MHSRLCALAAALAGLLAGSALALQCLDENGSPVEWWVILKGPTQRSNDFDGTEYAYADCTSSGAFVLSSKTIEDKDTAMSQTLAQIYDGQPSSTGWVIYNDENPDGSTDFDDGHTKGVVGWDADGGFWLVHSYPKFPGAVSSGSYNVLPGELVYGQSALCISLSMDVLDGVGHQLAYNQINMYDSNMPSSMASSLPNLNQIVGGLKLDSAVPSTKVLTGKSGTQFVSFAKSKQWDNDLYSALVEPYFSDDFFVETWMRPVQPNCCTPTCQYNSFNVQNLQIGDVSFTEYYDHSKWAVSSSASTAVVCVGDINRQQSQHLRGGGTVCMANSNLWGMFRKVVQAYEQC